MKKHRYNNKRKQGKGKSGKNNTQVISDSSKDIVEAASSSALSSAGVDIVASNPNDRENTATISKGLSIEPVKELERVESDAINTNLTNEDENSRFDSLLTVARDEQVETDSGNKREGLELKTKIIGDDNADELNITAEMLETDATIDTNSGAVFVGNEAALPDDTIETSNAHTDGSLNDDPDLSVIHTGIVEPDGIESNITIGAANTTNTEVVVETSVIGSATVLANNFEPRSSTATSEAGHTFHLGVIGSEAVEPNLMNDSSAVVIVIGSDTAPPADTTQFDLSERDSGRETVPCENSNYDPNSIHDTEDESTGLVGSGGIEKLSLVENLECIVESEYDNTVDPIVPDFNALGRNELESLVESVDTKTYSAVESVKIRPMISPVEISQGRIPNAQCGLNASAASIIVPITLDDFLGSPSKSISSSTQTDDPPAVTTDNINPISETSIEDELREQREEWGLYSRRWREFYLSMYASGNDESVDSNSDSGRFAESPASGENLRSSLRSEITPRQDISAKIEEEKLRIESLYNALVDLQQQEQLSSWVEDVCQQDLEVDYQNRLKLLQEYCQEQERTIEMLNRQMQIESAQRNQQLEILRQSREERERLSMLLARARDEALSDSRKRVEDVLAESVSLQKEVEETISAIGDVINSQLRMKDLELFVPDSRSSSSGRTSPTRALTQPVGLALNPRYAVGGSSNGSPSTSSFRYSDKQNLRISPKSRSIASAKSPMTGGGSPTSRQSPPRTDEKGLSSATIRPSPVQMKHLPTPVKQKYSIQNFNSLMSSGKRILFLCESSAAMNLNKELYLAQLPAVDSFSRQCLKRSVQFAIGLWGSTLRWPTENMRLGGCISSEEELNESLVFCQNSALIGAKDIRTSLMAATRAFPAATDIILFGDGDCYPFEPLQRRPSSHFQSDWCTFRKRYASFQFHFIAIKSPVASYLGLEAMAKDGGGLFGLIQ